MNAYIKLIKSSIPLPGILLPPDSKLSDLELDLDSKCFKIIFNNGTTMELPNMLDTTRNTLIQALNDPIYQVKTKVSNNKLHIKIYINKEQLDQICTDYKLAPDVLKEIIYKADHDTQWSPNYNDKDIPVQENLQLQIQLPHLDKLKISPYNYQINNIKWLLDVEQHVKDQTHYMEYVKINDLIRFKNKRFDYYLDKELGILYNLDSIWNSKRKVHCMFNGGILCDEVGLGKTLSMIGLILVDKYGASAPVKTPTPSLIQTKPNPKPTLKIKAKVKDLTKPPDQPSQQTQPIIKKKVIVKKKSVSDTDSIFSVSSNTSILPTISASSTTLVLCPRRLVAQWVSEIEKYTSHLVVYELRTLTDIKKYDKWSIQKADVVVVSFSLFNNKNYLAYEDFSLTEVKWHRVIIDEGHEVLLHKDKKLVADFRTSSYIFQIQSNYRWICTGTPLSEGYASFQAIISYLSGLKHNEHNPILDHIDETEYGELVSKLYRRNTRTSIEQQVQIPEHTEVVDYLEFTKAERAIYDSIDPTDTIRKLQVCTNLSVSDTDNEISGGNVLNLTQVTKAMGTHYMDNCTREQSNLVKYKKKIEDLKTERDDQVEVLEEEKESLYDPDEIKEIATEITRIKNNIRNRIKTLNSNIEQSTDNLNKYQKQLQVFRSLDLDITKSECPITGKKLKGQVAITPEGYYYSKAGLELLFLGGRKVAKCPCTRTDLDIDKVTFVDTDREQDQDDTDDLERSKWGTKMACVLNKIRNIKNGKVIIFSQWTKMLILMAKALKDADIKHVFCRGNIHVMSKSINLFKTDPNTKVILLSSDSCNSGSNLTEAEYVFLIDAVSGDRTHAEAVETQAIARTCRLGQRKQVQVYRFIVKDTIEEEYYKQKPIK